MRTRTRKVADDYLALVKQFPLRPIRDAAEHRVALRIVNRLVDTGNTITTGEVDYLQALAAMVERYERDRFPIGQSKPLDVLRHLMEENDLTAADLGRVIGSAPAASMILSGEREMSKTHIRKIAQRFHVSPALFL
jgi:HTH-type transcriptional regulator / antitoxin HigA